MPAKLIKKGIMFYILTDSLTGFVLKFKLYTGSYNPIKEAVKNLLVYVKVFNHTLYMNNYYNSFELCKNLRQEKIFCCGTMRMRRSEPSEYSTQKKRMSKNDFNYFQKNNINLHCGIIKNRFVLYQHLWTSSRS
ncbi:hypothetical protein CDIK_1069 [Cucumispora dikerogammari]|nr:hypothetical protein CDIK_1069 [Cucumispora dikerogammari]